VHGKSSAVTGQWWSVLASSLLRVSAVHGHVRLAGIVLATAGRSTRITGHNPITA
jgi:hypothetical protein